MMAPPVLRPPRPPLYAENVPPELRGRKQWVNWRYEWDGKKWTKVPYQPHGCRASSTDPATWSSFTTVLRAVEAGGFDGVGFVLTKDDPYVGFDFDNCYNGHVDERVADYVRRLASYTEVTPSGGGLRVWVKAMLPPGRRKKGGFEVYDTARFLTVTGAVLPGAATTIEERQDEAIGVWRDIFQTEQSSVAAPETPAPVDLADEELLEKARRAKNGALFEQLWRGDWQGAGYPSQSEADQALCNILAFWTGRDPARIDAIFRRSGLYRPKWDERHGAKTYGQMTVENAIAGTREVYDPKEDRPGPPTQGANASQTGLPRIQVNGREMREVTADAIAALEAANEPPFLFQRGGALVRVRMVPVNNSRGPEDLRPKIEILGTKAMRGILARVADWYVVTKTGEAPVPPPETYVDDLLNLPHWPFPTLVEVVESPVFDASGRIVMRPGYHPEAGILYHGSLQVPPVEQDPTPWEIEDARALLLDELLGDFPFVSESDRAHALALLLLPFVRRMIHGPTPLHPITAPKAGTGKGLLADVAGIVATGHVPVTIAEGRDDDEWRKRLTSVLMDTPVMVLIDNVTRPLDSGALSMALTQLEWTDRVLGHTRTITVPVRATWVATANNLRTSDEMARRSAPIRLDARVEQPHKRTGFRHPNLRQWARENRPRLVHAALTLGQAWIAAGRPMWRGLSLGSYEAWAEVMGGILEVAGVPGFLESLDEFYSKADRRSHEVRAFVEAWWERFGSATVSVAMLCDLARERDLIPDILGDGNDRSQKIRLGKALDRMEGQVFAGKRIVMAQERTRSARGHYRLEAADDVLPHVRIPPGV